ncbi:hypothetical protein SKAU_G00417840 [Synaphobranchus kaupii]|uniref:Uncharacterized protein n=1 Tax=Synaphobranchus kaupii TaxID=118154 RepID=A0A9Q1E617_SYNKA|nr:hypothetical protein SKAU_G00417840 [Synaphobranchus kaupii]
MIWSSVTKKDLGKLQLAQNRAARLALRCTLSTYMYGCWDHSCCCNLCCSVVDKGEEKSPGGEREEQKLWYYQSLQRVTNAASDTNSALQRSDKASVWD